MIARVEKVEGGYAILLPSEFCKAWNLSDGSAVEVHQVTSACVVDDSLEAIEAATERALAAYRDTLPQHEAAYRELAKGPEGVGPHDPAPFDLRKL
jgi:antitoxin component of MazEF toxin-antitoxin module